MKVIASKEKLANALQFAENIITAKTTISILSNILIETLDNHIRIVSTDLEVAIKILIKAEIVTPGSITLYAKKFTDIVKALPNDDIVISVDENNTATIKSKNEEVKAEFNIRGIPKNDYPVLPEIKTDFSIELSQKDLSTMIRKTIFAVSTEGINSAINGIKLELKDKKIKFVATDGRRLALIENEVKTDNEMEGITVPHKVLSELLKILSDEGKIQMGLSKNQIYFKIGDIELISRLIDGKFPDYTQVIPKNYSKKVIFYTNKMVNAIKRVSIITTEGKSGKIKLSFKKNKLELKSADPEIGEAREEIEVVYDYEDFEIAFSSEYLLDFINSIDTEKLIMGFNESESAAMGKEESNDNFLCLVMPIKLN